MYIKLIVKKYTPLVIISLALSSKYLFLDLTEQTNKYREQEKKHFSDTYK